MMTDKVNIVPLSFSLSKSKAKFSVDFSKGLASLILSSQGSMLVFFFFFLIKFKGTWVAQLVEHLTLGFGSGHDLRVMRLSPTVDSMLSGESA